MTRIDSPQCALVIADVHLDANSREQIRDHGVTCRDAFKLPAGHYAVHFVLLDVLSGKTGSVIASLEVQ